MGEYFKFKFFSRLKRAYPEEWKSLEFSDKSSINRIFYNNRIKREYYKNNEYKKLNDQELNKFVNLEAAFISLFFICGAFFVVAIYIF